MALVKSKQSCQDYIDEWNTGKPWIDNFTRDFQQLDDLADAVALSRVTKAPMVGDVTLASAVRQIPRASIQQLPTFSVEVNGTKMSIPAYLADFIVRRVVFNQDTFGKGILSTMQIGAESALTHGFQAAIASIGNINNDFGTTLKLIHYNDLVIEPGVFDGNESSYFQVRTRVTKGKIKKLIASAKKNPDTTWDVSALQELLASGPGSATYATYMSQPRYNASITSGDNTFDIITRYEVAPFGEVCTFSPQVTRPLRKMKSKSKFGYPRVSMLVIDPAQLLPFGVSRVRLASPAANYANIYLQSTAKMQLLNADPPVMQKGQFTTPIRLKRGALWQTIDPNAEVKLQELSNSTLSQFTNVLQFVDNQIYSIMGVTAGTVGAGNTDSNYSKTAAGVKMESQTRDLSTTQITNILENFLRQYALTALDLFVSEQVGETDLIVDDQCKDNINKWAEKKFLETTQTDPATGLPLQPFVPIIGDDNIIKVTWEDLYESIHTWTVDIDLSMSKDNMDEKKRADLQDMLTVVSQTGNPNDPRDAERKHELEDELIKQTLPDVARDSSGPAPQPLVPSDEVNQPF